MNTSKLLTSKNVQTCFGVSLMTVMNWRAGSPNRVALDCVADGRKVYFKPADIKRFAKTNGLDLLVDPNTLVGVTDKPGPKAAGKRKPATRH